MDVFSVLIGLGTLLGLGWVAWQAPEKQVFRHLDAGLWVLVGSLLGSRAAYVFYNWSYYRAHPLDIPQVWLGGFSGPGALAGALLALLVLALFTRQPLAILADAVLPLALTLTLTGWLACWQAGSAYGAETTSWWGMPARDEWGHMASRFPVQLTGALLTAGIIALLDGVRRWLTTPGATASLGLLGLSLESLGLSFLRADPPLVWHGMRLEAWTALGFTGVSIIALLVFYLIQRTKK